MKRIAILGCGGMGQETLDALLAHNAAGLAPPWDIAGFLSDDPASHGAEILGLPVLGGREWLSGNPGVAVSVAIGNTRVRRKLCEALEAAGTPLAAVVHPAAVCSPFAQVGAGSIICAGALLSTQVVLGRGVIVNVQASVSHDCVLGDFVSMHPGAHLTGNVTVEDGAEIGTGANVIPRTRIGRGAVIGAGAAVVRDVAADTVVAGTPARPLRKLPRDQHWNATGR